MSFLGGILDVGIVEDSAPETSHLVRVIDLYDCELLHEFSVDFELVLLELRNDLFPQVNRHNLQQRLQVINFLLSLNIITFSNLTTSILLTMPPVSF